MPKAIRYLCRCVDGGGRHNKTQEQKKMKNSGKKKSGMIRSRKAKFELEIRGGKVTVERLSESEKDALRKKFTTYDVRTGEKSLEVDALGEAVFRKQLVGAEGYCDQDGKEITVEELKDMVLEFDPEFFLEYTKMANKIFETMEDLSAKN